jgi:hypothetical protein
LKYVSYESQRISPARDKGLAMRDSRACQVNPTAKKEPFIIEMAELRLVDDLSDCAARESDPQQTHLTETDQDQ